MKKKLSALAITGLAQGEYHDALTPGLLLKVGSIRRTWVARYRKGGKRHADKLGYFPALSLAAARQAASDLLKRVEAGLPAPGMEAVQHPQSPARLTIGRLIDDYESMRMREGVRVKSLRRSLATLRHNLGDHLATPAIEFTRRDLRACRDRVAEAAPAMARRMISYIAPVLAWAVMEEKLESNVARDLRKGAEIKRRRKLTEPEIRRLWKACDNLDGGPSVRSFARLVQFLLVSGQRRSEVAGLRFGHILDGTWHMETNKADRPHKVPLPRLALDLIGKGSARDLVFPGKKGEISGFSKLKKELDTLASLGEEGWRLHDLRRTCSSGLGDLGVDDLVVRSVLNHAIVGALSHYMVAELQAQKKAALLKWADHIEYLVGIRPMSAPG